MVMNRLDVGAPQSRMVKKVLGDVCGNIVSPRRANATSVPKGNGGKRSQMLLN